MVVNKHLSKHLNNKLTQRGAGGGAELSLSLTLFLSLFVSISVFSLSLVLPFCLSVCSPLCLSWAGRPPPPSRSPPCPPGNLQERAQKKMNNHTLSNKGIINPKIDRLEPRTLSLATPLYIRPVSLCPRSLHHWAPNRGALLRPSLYSLQRSV